MSKSIKATIVAIALSIVPMAAIDATASAAPTSAQVSNQAHDHPTGGGTDWYSKPHQP